MAQSILTFLPRTPSIAAIQKKLSESSDLNIYKTLTFLWSRAVFSKTMRYTKMVIRSLDSPHYGGHRRHSLMLIE